MKEAHEVQKHLKLPLPTILLQISPQYALQSPHKCSRPGSIASHLCRLHEFHQRPLAERRRLGFSNSYEQVVEILACPKADNKTCMFMRKTYDLTIPRELNISASAADVDNIFYLASQAYGAWPANYTRDPFIARNTTASTLNSRVVFETLLEVEPGKNKSLEPIHTIQLWNFGWMLKHQFERCRCEDCCAVPHERHEQQYCGCWQLGCCYW